MDRHGVGLSGGLNINSDRSSALFFAAQRNVDRTKPQAISGACGLNWREKNAEMGL